jgi:hypothetical protein
MQYKRWPVVTLIFAPQSVSFFWQINKMVVSITHHQFTIGLLVDVLIVQCAWHYISQHCFSSKLEIGKVQQQKLYFEI